MDGKIHQITRDSGCTEATVYITGYNNFRKAEATILPYKGNRKGKEKPYHYYRLKSYLLKTKNHKVILCPDFEADDGLSIAQIEAYDERLGKLKEELYSKYAYGDTCLCSRDKDLLMVPGHHFIWTSGKQKEQTLFITPLEGMRWFFKQLLMGDKGTDNILGLFGVGPKSTLVTDLNGMNDCKEMYAHVRSKYFDRFGNHWEMFMHENARLLWMLQYDKDDIRCKLRVWEGFRLYQSQIVERY